MSHTTEPRSRERSTAVACPNTSSCRASAWGRRDATPCSKAGPCSQYSARTLSRMSMVTLPSEVGLACSCCCWGAAGPPLRRRLAPPLGRPRLRRCRLVGGEPEKKRARCGSKSCRASTRRSCPRSRRSLSSHCPRRSSSSSSSRPLRVWDRPPGAPGASSSRKASRSSSHSVSCPPTTSNIRWYVPNQPPNRPSDSVRTSLGAHPGAPYRLPFVVLSKPDPLALLGRYCALPSTQVVPSTRH
uniref:Uncharacterized protein n=1 Tax=Myotis lucifugus TaxID=59463 RepID=G1Q8L2_MYOLU